MSTINGTLGPKLMPIDKPLTTEQIDRMLEKNVYIKVEIALPIDALIDNDRESLAEYVGDRIVEGVLRDVTYDIKGYTFNGCDENGDYMPKLVILEVTGKPILE